jgi:hypothetical protein
MKALEATGTLIWKQFAQFQHARGLFKMGNADAALEIVRRILSDIAATRGRWYEAEVHRFEGDLLTGAGNKIDAARSYESAMACAARQGAGLFEQRAKEALDRVVR